MLDDAGGSREIDLEVVKSHATEIAPLPGKAHKTCVREGGIGQGDRVRSASLPLAGGVEIRARVHSLDLHLNLVADRRQANTDPLAAEVTRGLERRLRCSNAID